mgnify:CR=1
MFKALKTKFINYRRYKETRNELHRLTDRDLADLGISRYDINHIARLSVNS